HHCKSGNRQHMAKKVKNADMFDVHRFKCWMFPCLESDINNQEFNADQQRKIRETMRQKKENNTENG
ncbi:MAG: hypothetical protein ACK6EB_20345, partial [Planctomyces sp.]